MNVQKLQEANQLNSAIAELEKFCDVVDLSRNSSIEVHLNGGDYASATLNLTNSVMRNAVERIVSATRLHLEGLRATFDKL